MLDIGWSELFVIGIVALIVVGPKDLPVMFRTLGRFTAKARSMGREFQRAMDKAADDSGMTGVAKDLKNVTSPSSLGIDALQNAASKFEKWDPLKPALAAKPALGTAAKSAAAAAADIAPPADAAPAVVATPVVAPPVAGPETQALAAKRAEEQAALLKRFAKPEPVAAEPAPKAPAAKRARAASAQTTAATVATAATEAAPAPKPRKAKAVADAPPAAKGEKDAVTKPKATRAKKSDA